MIATRKAWQERIDALESDNRNDINALHEEEEETRRFHTRPEHEARDDTQLPMCEIPRGLIELSKE